MTRRSHFGSRFRPGFRISFIEVVLLAGLLVLIGILIWYRGDWLQGLLR